MIPGVADQWQNKQEIRSDADKADVERPPETNITSQQDLNLQWAELKLEIQHSIGKDKFTSWIEPLAIQDASEGVITLTAPNRYTRDVAANDFGELIHRFWQQKRADIVRVLFEVAKRREETERHSASSTLENDIDKKAIAEKISASRLDPGYRFETFVTSVSNEFAYAAAQRISSCGSATYNPLFLYGGVGLGKTHLMHAIAWSLSERLPDAQVLYLSAEQFMQNFVSSLRTNDMIGFKKRLRSVDVLLVDDLQFIAGKESTQEEFFHTFNVLIGEGKQIVVSADRCPGDLDGIAERLRSRLAWGLVVDIQPADYELRLGILQQKASALQKLYPNLTIEQDILSYLARHITSNIRELEGAFTRIAAQSALIGRVITLDLVRESLANQFRSSRNQPTVEEIQEKVAEYFGIKIGDLLSPRRARSIARPRQVAMFLCKQLTRCSFPEIGKKFGGRDHTTVMHAIRRVEELSDVDEKFAADLEKSRRFIINC